MKTGVGLQVLLLWFASASGTAATMATIALPEPRLQSDTSIEQALLQRRSVRELREEPLTLAELGQLLWAAQGITSPRGFRTAPSAGALYPLEIHVLVGAVEGLKPGIYRYLPDSHALQHRRDGEHRDALAEAALQQACVRTNAVVLAFSAVASRTTAKYGGRGERYVLMEVGHAAQNVFLQVQSLGLAAVVVGAFDDDAVDEVLDLPSGERALYLMPVGRRG